MARAGWPESIVVDQIVISDFDHFFEARENSFPYTGQVSTKGIEITPQIDIRKFEEHVA